MIDVSVTNLFTRETFTFANLKVKYKEGSKENQKFDNEDDKYMDVATAHCDYRIAPGRYLSGYLLYYIRQDRAVKTLPGNLSAGKGRGFR